MELIGALFDLIGRAVHAGWDLLSGVAELSMRGVLAVLGVLWDLATGILGAAWRLLCWAADLLFRPVSVGLDRLWDWGVQGCWEWGGIFLTVFLTLLGACVLLALLAAGAAAWRRFKTGQKHELGPKL